MFENLQEKLQRAFKSLRGQAKLTEENIDEALREIRLALLEADVNFKVVKQLIDQIRAKAVGQEVLTALSPGEQVIKIVRDELVQAWRAPSPAGFGGRLPSGGARAVESCGAGGEEPHLRRHGRRGEHGNRRAAGERGTPRSDRFRLRRANRRY